MPPNPNPPAGSVIIIVSPDAQQQAGSRRYRGFASGRGCRVAGAGVVRAMCRRVAGAGGGGSGAGDAASILCPARRGRRRCRSADWRPNDHHTPGLWEAGLMRFGNRGRSLRRRHERHARLLLAWRPGSKAVAEWRHSVDFDNGTEFARQQHLYAAGIRAYFCEVKSPWQKGGVENAIGWRWRYPAAPG